MIRKWFVLSIIGLISFFGAIGCASTTSSQSARVQGSIPGQGNGQNPSFQSGNSTQASSPTLTPGTNNSSGGIWTKKEGDLQVTLKITPFPPVGRSVSTFEITLADDAVRPIPNAQVDLDLTMPGMWMPPNKPKAQSVGEGHYTASSRMGMRGQWQIAVIVQQNAQTQTVNFLTEVP